MLWITRWLLGGGKLLRRLPPQVHIPSGYLEQPFVVNRSCKFGVFFLRLLHYLEKWILQLQLRCPHQNLTWDNQKEGCFEWSPAGTNQETLEEPENFPEVRAMCHQPGSLLMSWEKTNILWKRLLDSTDWCLLPHVAIACITFHLSKFGGRCWPHHGNSLSNLRRLPFL